ncbi:MinD/ParA family protein [Oceanirhabdus seepicola]|uniref:MinD/ParA family protein n=1 Tax=Oceanirhabdus seepicola TaxID=2828781 RepID=A0A9J6PA98_9CLOT|nr:MinD/ParA family protein [Oceanirhabdus seepicola]
MMDQASKLRELFNGKNPVGDSGIEKSSRIITITSGKGGVGKSNFVVNIGLTLQKMGKKVLIFDADIGMGNDDVLMGIISKRSIYDIIKKDFDIEDVLVDGPMGLKLLPGGSGLMNIDDLNQIERDRFLSKLGSLSGYDYIFIDTGAGISRSVLSFIACSEELIVVTTPEPTSLTDAYSLLKAVNHYKIKDKANLVINRVFSEGEGTKTFKKIEKVVSSFLSIKLQTLGCISDDKELVKSVRMQKPLVLRSIQSEAIDDFKEIALKLEGSGMVKEKNDMKGFFKKVFNLFS